MKNCRRKGNRVITGEVVIMNSNLTSPKKCFGTKKYGTTLILHKNDETTTSSIQEAMRVAFEEKAVTMFRNTDTELKFEEFISPLKTHSTNEDIYYLRTMSREKPEVIDKQKTPLDKKTSICDGALARVSMTFDCANIAAEQKKIIYAILDNVQILDNNNHLRDIELEKHRYSALEDFDDDCEVYEEVSAEKDFAEESA